MSTNFNLINQAYSRMRRACDRGTGCHLTAEMIQELSVTTLGEWWSQADVDEDGFGGSYNN